MLHPIPTPDSQTGLRALRALLQFGHPLAALQVFHNELGDIFRVNLPGFTPVVLVGPQAARFVLVQKRGELRWRNENDPVTHLLRHGVLVEDGEVHDRLRRTMNPALHRRMLAGYVADMWTCARQVTAEWGKAGRVDMLVEMRKVALLALMQTLYRVDYTPQLRPLWDAVLGSIRFISPGLWMIWQGMPQPQYRRAIRQVDDYLYQIIAQKRTAWQVDSETATDLLGLLIDSGMDDHLIRDQLLTILIAGHDTVTALMAWALFLLGQHPQVYRKVQAEVVSVLDPVEPPTVEHLERLDYLDWVIKEALRMYPPIHLGSRLAAVDLEYEGFLIPAGERVIYSIYLTQRDSKYWPDPNNFLPERHAPGNRQIPYAWLAFGGGPRNCIGAAFGQLEAKVVLGMVLRCFDLLPIEARVKPHMGATLEPRPGVIMQVQERL
jgi:cytochrome P450